MSHVLLSIKPKYVERILSGEKWFEFRRVIPKQTVDSIFVYASAPVCRVVAEVKVLRVFVASKDGLWHLVSNFYSGKAGVSEEEFFEYFDGCEVASAFMLGRVRRFRSKKMLSAFGLKCAPQNFCYVQVGSLEGKV